MYNSTTILSNELIYEIFRFNCIRKFNPRGKNVRIKLLFNSRK